MPQNDPNIWIQIYENTPTGLRWLLSILTLGILSAYHYLWKRSQQRLADIEERERSYITKGDFRAMDNKIDGVHNDVKTIMFHIMKGK